MIHQHASGGNNYLTTTKEPGGGHSLGILTIMTDDLCVTFLKHN